MAVTELAVLAHIGRLLRILGPQVYGFDQRLSEPIPPRIESMIDAPAAGEQLEAFCAEWLEQNPSSQTPRDLARELRQTRGAKRRQRLEALLFGSEEPGLEAVGKIASKWREKLTADALRHLATKYRHALWKLRGLAIFKEWWRDIDPATPGGDRALITKKAVAAAHKQEQMRKSLRGHGENPEGSEMEDALHEVLDICQRRGNGPRGGGGARASGEQTKGPIDPKARKVERVDPPQAETRFGHFEAMAPVLAREVPELEVVRHVLLTEAYSSWREALRRGFISIGGAAEDASRIYACIDGFFTGFRFESTKKFVSVVLPFVELKGLLESFYTESFRSDGARHHLRAVLSELGGSHTKNNKACVYRRRRRMRETDVLIARTKAKYELLETISPRTETIERMTREGPRLFKEFRRLSQLKQHDGNRQAAKDLWNTVRPAIADDAPTALRAAVENSGDCAEAIADWGLYGVVRKHIHDPDPERLYRALEPHRMTRSGEGFDGT